MRLELQLSLVCYCICVSTSLAGLATGELLSATGELLSAIATAVERSDSEIQAMLPVYKSALWHFRTLWQQRQVMQ